ncbi:MAG: DUF3500 domain-containing protein, partial [Bryobacteraceae bacterium]|nr:DUF3500 domain-containing protein [Bryobacteraceae bacterium]
MFRITAASTCLTLSLLAATAQDPAPVLTTVANNFLASLSTEQSAKARFAFADEERFNWHFIPKERKGLPIREMAPFQRHLASALLNAALSQKG